MDAQAEQYLEATVLLNARECGALLAHGYGGVFLRMAFSPEGTHARLCSDMLAQQGARTTEQAARAMLRWPLGKDRTQSGMEYVDLLLQEILPFPEAA